MFPLTTDTDNNVARITVQCAYTIYNIYICIYIQKRSLDLQTDILSLSLTHSLTHSLLSFRSLPLSPSLFPFVSQNRDCLLKFLISLPFCPPFHSIYHR